MILLGAFEVAGLAHFGAVRLDESRQRTSDFGQDARFRYWRNLNDDADSIDQC